MLAATSTVDAPGTVVTSNDTKRARIEAMRWVLARFPCTGRDDEPVGVPDGRVVGSASMVHEAGEQRA